MKHVIFVFITLLTVALNYGQYCPSKVDKHGMIHQDCREERTRRYLLYDVNPGEGFNLRRDVYLRMATMTKVLQKYGNWILVLPPWPHLYHWKSDIEQDKLPWHKFFNINSLNEYTPVMEFETYIEEQGSQVEAVLYLQAYDTPWEGGWEEKYNITNCKRNTPYHKDKEFFKGHFYGFNDVYASNLYCVSFQGSGETLIELITESNASSLFIDRAENILHSHYGGYEYWSARKSMKFSTRLVEIAEEFVRNTLTKNLDPTRVNLSLGEGLPYIAAHLRRQDFLHSRKEHVPTLQYAAHKVSNMLSKLGLHTVFLSTDGTAEETKMFEKLLPKYKVASFKPNNVMLEQIGDGGTAIVDQIICSFARHFIGSYESTFSFRIQEEREILGFHPDTTFNRFCAENEVKCEQPARWRIVNQ